jgi:transcriptional regulator with XRE-family HTH domain
MLQPAQCRAARVLLGWHQEDLSKRAGISRATLVQFELGKRVMAYVVEGLERVFAEAGVELLEPGDTSAASGGWGVRLRGK